MRATSRTTSGPVRFTRNGTLSACGTRHRSHSLKQKNWTRTRGPVTTNNPTGGTSPAGEAFGIYYDNPTDPVKKYLPAKIANAQTFVSGDQSKFSRAMTYDSAGNVLNVADNSPTQIQASLTYYNGTDGAKNGLLKTATDGNGNVTTYKYDTPGNLTEIEPPILTTGTGTQMGDTLLSYDALGRVRTYTDGKGQTRTYSYDKLDRVTGVAFASGSLTNSYDDNGNQTSAVDTTAGTFGATYDRMNRITQQTYPGSRLADYTWDATSNLATLQDGGSGTQVSYTYNEANEPKTVTEPGSAVTSFTYDARGNRQDTTYPNSWKLEERHDASNKLTSITTKNPAGTDKQKFTYAYADGARQTELRQSVTELGGDFTDYDYDPLERLIDAEKHTGSSGGPISRVDHYTYDPASNRTKREVTISGTTTTTTYAYNKQNQLCWRYTGTSANTCASAPGGAVTHTFDAAGNETGHSQGRSHTLNNRNQTTSITNGGVTTANTFLGEGQSAMLSEGSTTLQDSVLGLGRTITGGTSTYYTRDPGGRLLSMRGASKYYYAFDGLGTVTALIPSGTGTTNLSHTASYDPYGLRITANDSVGNPFEYAGGHQTVDGMYHYGERFYHPDTARWSQADPLDNAGDLREANRYAYVGADPINSVDLSGLFGITLKLKNPFTRIGVRLSVLEGDAVLGATGFIGGKKKGAQLHVGYHNAGQYHKRAHCQVDLHVRGKRLIEARCPDPD